MVSNDQAEQRAYMPAGTERILNVRDLQTAHQRLAELIQPGMRILDVGCGTGSITCGMAEAVGPDGFVIGIDDNPTLIDQANQKYHSLSNLAFEVENIYTMGDYKTGFEIVSAARVLQWLNRPSNALEQMVSALSPEGQVVILDYNHEQIGWAPVPPDAFRLFYDAFLRWRADAGMDNAIADHLADMLQDAGLTAITITAQHEHTNRSDSAFLNRIGIWAEVAATRGRQMVSDGYLTEAERATAETVYRQWIKETSVSQTMYLLAVEGVRTSEE